MKILFHSLCGGGKHRYWPPTSLVSVSITLNVTFLCIVVTIELDTYQSLSINIEPARLARIPMDPDIFTTMTREIKFGVPIVDLE